MNNSNMKSNFENKKYKIHFNQNSKIFILRNRKSSVKIKYHHKCYIIIDFYLGKG